MTNTSKLNEAIDIYGAGIPFGAKDFLDCGNYDAIRKQLIRKSLQGEIIRILNGVYCKPEYSKLTGELIPADMEKVAEYLARRYGWQVVPSTQLALNYLGLSSQVPVKFEFLSSGPYRDFNIQNKLLSFKHTANKNLFNITPESALLIQALNSLGKNGINEDDLRKISRCFSRKQLETALKESSNNKVWIYQTIKKLLEEKDD